MAVLIVEDDPGDAKLVQRMLREYAHLYETELVGSVSAAIKRLHDGSFEVVLLDIGLPDSQGIDTVLTVHTECPGIPIVVLTGADDEQTGVRAVRIGAQDFIGKGMADARLLTRSIRYAVERKRAEEEARKSEEKYRNVVENSNDGICIIQDNLIKYSNDQLLRIAGYSAKEVVDKRYEEFIPEDMRRDIQGRYARLMSSEENAQGCETALQHKDGLRILVEVNASAIDYHNHPAMLVFVRDITEKRRMEDELRKAQKLESIGILAGGIAHDFNNLLTAIMGNISIAKTGIHPAEKIYRILSDAERAATLAKNLTHQLLTFAKGGAPVKESASIEELLRDSASFLVRGSKVKCEFKLSDNVQPLDIDRGQIGQVIQNLILNAEQAMPEGGIIGIRTETVTISDGDVVPLKSGRYVKISIRDDGIGIRQEDLGRIFDPYFTTKTEGSGLGLATAYSIIKRHDGFIGAESTPGIGTLFEIYLPASQERIRKTEYLEEELDEGRGRILVMDDEEVVRDVAGEMLRHMGYDVELASDGAEAIDVYMRAKESGHAFEVVLLDLTVPAGMGGIETQKRLLEIDPEVNSIVSSGYSNDPIMSRYEEKGFRAVLTKPYNIQELGKTLQHVIRKDTSS